MVSVRPITPADTAAALAIYAPYILGSAATFEADVPDAAAFQARIQSYTARFPWLVVEIGGAIAGYAYGSTHRDRSAYQWTCESSIYVAPAFQGRGVARPLYEALLALLRHQGFRTVYAGITLPNEASVRLHEKLGFTPFAVFENVGFKLGAWQKVGWWRQALNSFTADPAPPILFPQLASALLLETLRPAEENILSALTRSG
jgi:L-amino acid N-acyltransferase YncA